MALNPLYVEVEALQDLMIHHATGGYGNGPEYKRLRGLLISNLALKPLLPTLVAECRDLGQFWEHISSKFEKYSERRRYLWAAFRPLLDTLDADRSAPSDASVAIAVVAIDSAHIDAAWRKALERRDTDAEGAITAARTLLETTCKHILDERGASYHDASDLNQLYRQTADALKIAPTQHTEQVFKQILGGCTSVVEGLGALRNRVSDAHGKGKRAVRPAPRHAELAVNLAGALATFLLATHRQTVEGRKG